MKKRRTAQTMAVAGCAALGMLAVSAHAAAPAGHFTAPGDGTVRDNLTGLVWQQGFSPSTHDRPGAAAYCVSLPLAGGGWRLPTIIELRSIVDETAAVPAIDTAYFPGTPPQDLWSSTPFAGSASDAWSIDFFGGWAHGLPVGGMHYARCVR